MKVGRAQRWRAAAGALSAQWLAIMLTAAVSLALSVWLARRMEPAGFGHYAYLLNLATLLALAQDAGLRTLLLRERVAAGAALAAWTDRLPGLARGHLLLATGLLAVGSLALVPWGIDPALALAVLCFGAVGLSQLVSVQLKALGQWSREGRWQVAARLLSALAVVAAVLLFGADPGVVFAAWAVGLLLAYGLLGRDLHYRPRWLLQAPVYRAAAGFLWIDLATGLYRRSDIVILHGLAASAEVGHYAAALRLFDGVLLLASPLALFFFRRLRMVRTDVEAARRLQRGCLLLALFAGIALALAGALLGSWLITWLYGAAYAASTGPLVGWLFAAFVFVLPNYVLTQTAIALDRERCYMLGAALAAVTSLALNLLLIPHHGVAGAVMALIATEAVLCVTLFMRLRKA